MNASAAPLVEVRGVSKRYPGVLALDNASLTVSPGEIVALTGENGSGKSTLSKIIGGAEQPDGGTVLVDGVETVIANPATALQLGIVMISQELTLAPQLTVAENVFMGRLPRRGRVIDWATARRRAREELAALDVHVDVDAKVGDLSVELQQEVEIARAVSSKARLLILDEATSSLSEHATERLLELVRDQAERGVAVLMISHRMPELYATASRAAVLRDGKLVGTVPLPSTPESQLVRMMVGRELNDYYGSRDCVPGDVVLQVRDLASADGALAPTSFEVRSGEIVGIAGLVGSGKAQLGMALGGAIAATGDVRVNGTAVALGDPRRALGAGIGLVPDDRKRAALLPTRSVAHNMTLTWLPKLSKLGVVPTRTEKRRVREAIAEYGVKTSSPAKLITQLSGGNQQKAILGRIFALDCPVYVLSEPTRGVDVGSKSQIYALLQKLTESGAAVVIISSELPELIGLADRVLVCFQGAVRGEVSGEQLQEEVLNAIAVSGHVHSEEPS
ncbi:putative ribose/galactose/methyl galactoside import ATP-binding protein 3 [Paractinoplanes abujensis]|uniref:ABC-type sugar transport system ATPase subunit n=1 Tax=Paractinoplanes abujensis TaxID=882441 RepID=A0A7W7CSJ5_9ACTN|nr:sugar ABC transporter ATP-binding protein [Actinoplanes abujensis]MBB4693884.1 ABC-type sugar transport system ATPase subunit [Actinoplanes abujensis]GID21459.1 putative ribose/galactose/methyl galactoside import ATP-binding protein 3 [Actinoplanes abujensis]